MFCGSNYKNEKTKPLLHDANSKRGGVLMHSKMLIAMFEPIPTTLGASGSSKAEGKQKAKVSDVGGWFYVGSHNFSPAAWGTLNFKNKPPTLNVSFARVDSSDHQVNNYELGIMLPIRKLTSSFGN